MTDSLAQRLVDATEKAISSWAPGDGSDMAREVTIEVLHELWAVPGGLENVGSAVINALTALEGNDDD